MRYAYLLLACLALFGCHESDAHMNTMFLGGGVESGSVDYTYVYDDADEVYDFDTTNGITDANKDSSHDLTDNNTVTTDGADYKQGDQSIDGDGVNEYLSLADDVDFDAQSSSFSIAFWTKMDAASDDFASKYSSDTGWSVENAWNVDDAYLCVRTGNGAASELHFTTVSDGTLGTGWFHIVISFETTGDTMAVWVSSDGGTFGDTFDNSGSPFSVTYIPANSTAQLWIGKAEPGSCLDGHMDEFAWWKGTALTAAEAEAVYKGTASGGWRE